LFEKLYSAFEITRQRGEEIQAAQIHSLVFEKISRDDESIITVTLAIF
jgi:hypothetical protein